ncbi:MAG: TatD family hydrolase [Clostridia bacterium]|nr:TatD family hydrolase [Clostridia bacterium]
MRLFDTHCHLNDPQFDVDRGQVISGLKDHGVVAALVAGSDMPSSRLAAALSAENAMLYAAVGIHPHEAASFHHDNLDELSLLVHHKRVAAIGEIGLDYYYDHSERPVQRDVFMRQLELAYSFSIPVICHVRSAHDDIINLMGSRKGKLPSGVIHCFSGNTLQASRYLDMGFYISFAGPLTYKNAVGQREVAAYVPYNRILAETDAPYLSPVPLRGRRNEPAHVSYIIKKMAEVKCMDEEQLAETLIQNACKVFCIPLL